MPNYPCKMCGKKCTQPGDTYCTRCQNASTDRAEKAEEALRMIAESCVVADEDRDEANAKIAAALELSRKWPAPDPCQEAVERGYNLAMQQITYILEGKSDG